MTPARRRPVVYRMYDGGENLLYIGCTDALMRRLNQHEGERDWYDTVASVTVQHFDTKAEALNAESEAIAAESPPHNIDVPRERLRVQRRNETLARHKRFHEGLRAERAEASS